MIIQRPSLSILRSSSLLNPSSPSTHVRRSCFLDVNPLEFSRTPVKPSSASSGSATSLLEKAEFTLQNVATPALINKLIEDNH